MYDGSYSDYELVTNLAYWTAWTDNQVNAADQVCAAPSSSHQGTWAHGADELLVIMSRFTSRQRPARLSSCGQTIRSGPERTYAATSQAAELRPQVHISNGLDSDMRTCSFMTVQ